MKHFLKIFIPALLILAILVAAMTYVPGASAWAWLR